MQQGLHNTAESFAETTLLSSIQRAKDRILKNSHHKVRGQSNDENDSLQSNTDNLKTNQDPVFSTKTFHKQIDQQSRFKYERKLKERLDRKNEPKIQHSEKHEVFRVENRQLAGSSRSTDGQIKLQKSQHEQHIAANAIKVLQEKIQRLQAQNQELLYENQKNLSEKEKLSIQLQQSRKEVIGHNREVKEQEQLQSDSKYWVLKQEFQTLQKKHHNLSQALELESQKAGRLLDFHKEHQASQDNSNSPDKGEYNFTRTQVSLEMRLREAESELQRVKAESQLERRSKDAVMKMHKEEIVQNQELSHQLTKKDSLIKELRQQLQSSRRPNSSNRLEPEVKSASLSMIRKKNKELHIENQQLSEELLEAKQRIYHYERLAKESERKHLEIRGVLTEITKDLNLYHPEIITSNLKYLFDKIKKLERAPVRSKNGVHSTQYHQRRSNHFMRSSISTSNNKLRSSLSGYKSKSGKKGLKMEDLNSSKRSLSRERSHSNKSSRSNAVQEYRSPYAQSSRRKNRVSSALSPGKFSNSKQFHNRSNEKKLSEIQKIMKEIKSLSKEMQFVKNQHRNLTIKVEQGDKSSRSHLQNKKKMNELTELFVQNNERLQSLKAQKDLLALETVPAHRQ